jgi:hypothetical protein
LVNMDGSPLKNPDSAFVCATHLRKDCFLSAVNQAPKRKLAS